MLMSFFTVRGSARYSGRRKTRLPKAVSSRKFLFPLSLFFGGVFFLAASNSGGFWVSSHVRLPLLTDSQRAVEAFGSSDAGSYLQLALSLKELGIEGVRGYSWVFNLWSPGMVFFDLFVLFLEDLSGIPFLLLTVLIASGLWGFTLASIFQFVSARNSTPTAVGISAFIMLSSLFAPFGTKYIAYADGFATCAAALAVLYLARASENQDRREKVRLLTMSGLALTFALYMRSVYETLTIVTFFLALFGILVTSLVQTARSKRPVLRTDGSLMGLFLVSFFSLLLTIPWRIAIGFWIRPGDFSWTVGAGRDYFAWAQRWMPSELLHDVGASWLVDGGVNYPCRVDPTRCREIYELEILTASPYSGSGHYRFAEFYDLAVVSFLEMPFAYASDRLTWFFKGFFSRTGSGVGDPAIAEGVILLLAIVLVGIVLFRRPAVFEAGFALGLIHLSLMGAVMMVIHMETRYTAGIKMTIVMLFCLITPYLREALNWPTRDKAERLDLG